MRVAVGGLLLSLLILFSWSGVVQAPMDAASSVQWLRILGSGTARCIQLSRDGGYLLSGWKEGRAGEGSAIFVIKTDLQGHKIWETVLPGNGFSCAYALCSGSRGGVIVVGDTKSRTAFDHDVFVAELDAEGHKIWESNFGGLGCDYGAAVTACSDGGCLVLGGTESFGAGAYDFYLLRLNSEGRRLWAKTYGGSGSDCGYALVPDRDGGYLLAGSTDSTQTGHSNIYLVKIDSSGNLCWQQQYGGSHNCYAWSLQASGDENYLIAGEREELTAKGGGFKSCLLKIDRQGRLIWEHHYDHQSYSTAYALVQEGEGQVLLLGKQENTEKIQELYLLQTDDTGMAGQPQTISSLGRSCAYAGLQSRDGGYVITGQSGSQTDQQILLLKLFP